MDLRPPHIHRRVGGSSIIPSCSCCDFDNTTQHFHSSLSCSSLQSPHPIPAHCTSRTAGVSSLSLTVKVSHFSHHQRTSHHITSWRLASASSRPRATPGCPGPWSSPKRPRKGRPSWRDRFEGWPPTKGMGSPYAPMGTSGMERPRVAPFSIRSVRVEEWSLCGWLMSSYDRRTTCLVGRVILSCAAASFLNQPPPSLREKFPTQARRTGPPRTTPPWGWLETSATSKRTKLAWPTSG